MSVYARRGLAWRLVCLAVASAWWLVTRRRGGVVTLCYHGVSDGERARFARQMRAIAGRAVAATDDIAPGKHRPRVCVTFDDAFANLLENALPAAARANVPVTVFAVTGAPGAAPHWPLTPGHPDAAECTMTATELEDAARRPGCTIGSHSISHRPLTELSPDDAALELAGSRARLEAITGTDVLDFAFPYGAVDEDLLAAASAAGYARLYTLDSPPGAHRLPGGARVVGRQLMSPSTWPIEFRLTVDGAYAWLPALRRLVRSRRPHEPRNRDLA